MFQGHTQGLGDSKKTLYRFNDVHSSTFQPSDLSPTYGKNVRTTAVTAKLANPNGIRNFQLKAIDLS
jgi:hypothetical protein